MKNLLTKRGEAISEADFDEIMEALNIGIDGKIKHQGMLFNIPSYVYLYFNSNWPEYRLKWVLLPHLCLIKALPNSSL